MDHSKERSDLREGQAVTDCREEIMNLMRKKLGKMEKIVRELERLKIIVC
jgi:hypothetical protein